MPEKLVEVKDVEISFGEGSKKFVAVHNANFFINKGETFSLVGESGSGKTTIGRAIIGLNDTGQESKFQYCSILRALLLASKGQKSAER